MELKVYSIDGNDTGRTVIVDDALFGTEPNDHVLWLAVKQFLANQRQGTHKTIVGGGRAFGPRPRDYRFKLNKKVKRLARLSALYYKSKEDNVLVVEDFSFDMPKTKNMVKVLSALKLQDKKTLFVVNTDPKNFVTLSARNIANVKVMNAASVNAYEVLNAKKLVFSETAIVELDKMCANS